MAYYPWVPWATRTSTFSRQSVMSLEAGWAPSTPSFPWAQCLTWKGFHVPCCICPSWDMSLSASAFFRPVLCFVLLSGSLSLVRKPSSLFPLLHLVLGTLVFCAELCSPGLPEIPLLETIFVCWPPALKDKLQKDLNRDLPDGTCLADPFSYTNCYWSHFGPWSVLSSP